MAVQSFKAQQRERTLGDTSRSLTARMAIERRNTTTYTATRRRQKGSHRNSSSQAGVSLLFVLLFCCSFILQASAHVTCQTDEECEVAYRTGSKCINGRCNNPFQDGGCLHQVIPGWTKIRVCNSEDPIDAAEKGYCRLPSDGFDHTEIRIGGQNWESAFFHAWILQILLSEMLDVPVTIETGTAEAKLDFYDTDMPFDYGVGYTWDGLRLANEVVDCRLVEPQQQLETGDRSLRRSEGPEYKACSHVIPEVWDGPAETVLSLEQEGVIEPAQGMGAFGHMSWFIPRFTGKRDLTLFSYMGLQGEKNRRKLAEMFKRPTSWKEYCDLVSSDGCQTPDEVAQRAPQDESEESRMFVHGLYTGHFRKTEKNDCDKNPTSCTGHIVDFPCGWSSFVKQQAHHLQIFVESNGPEPVSGGYTYGQMTEIWAAANATKSDVLMMWWTPEALFQEYLGTDAEFQRINLPPPSQACVDARVGSVDRCEAETEVEQVGDSAGSCDYIPIPLNRLTTNSLYSISHGPSVTPGGRSPAYDTIKAFTFSGLQIGNIFERWIEVGVDKWNYDPREAVCTWAADNIELLETFIPRSFPREVHDTEEDAWDPLFYITIVAASIATTLTMGCIYGTYKNRKKKLLVYAQVEFLWLLLAGLLMVAIGSLLLPIPPTDGICTVTAWLVSLGYTLELAPLIVKIAAINRIMMAASRMKRVVLKQSTLFGIVFLMSLIVTVFLVFWSVLDTPRRSIDYYLTDQETENGDTIVMATPFCTSDSETWNYISIGWHTVLLLCATVLAFQTRKVEHDVNECQTLAILIYSHFVFVVLQTIVFMLEDVLQVSEIARYQSLLYSVDVIAACCIYFLPKFAGKDIPLAQRRAATNMISGHSTAVNTENPLRRSRVSGQSSDNRQGSSHHLKPSVSMACEKQAIQELSNDLSDADLGSSFEESFSEAAASRNEAHRDVSEMEAAQASSVSMANALERHPDRDDLVPADRVASSSEPPPEMPASRIRQPKRSNAETPVQERQENDGSRKQGIVNYFI